MQRFIVFLLLIVLPVRTVLAVSGLGCVTMPAQKAQTEKHAAPCAMHAAESAPVEAAGETNETAVSCPSCTLACCAALAPDPAQVAPTTQTLGFVAPVIEISFVNAVAHALERPPRLA